MIYVYVSNFPQRSADKIRMLRILNIMPVRSDQIVHTLCTLLWKAHSIFRSRFDKSFFSRKIQIVNKNDPKPMINTSVITMTYRLVCSKNWNVFKFMIPIKSVSNNKMKTFVCCWIKRTPSESLPALFICSLGAQIFILWKFLFTNASHGSSILQGRRISLRKRCIHLNIGKMVALYIFDFDQWHSTESDVWGSGRRKITKGIINVLLILHAIKLYQQIYFRTACVHIMV